MTTIKLKNGSGAPATSDLVQGEPALDLTNKRLYTEDSGGSVIEVGTNPGTDVTFADDTKAIFGAGSDLQIYHSGSNSFVDAAGVGHLYLQAQGDDKDVKIRSDDGVGGLTEYFRADGSIGEAQLFHFGSKKLNTTSTGIDVTGTVTLDDTLNISGGSTTAFVQASGTSFQIGASTASSLVAYTNNVERMRIDSSGNVMIGATSTTKNFLIENPSTASGEDVSFRLKTNGTGSSADSIFEMIASTTGECLINFGDENDANIGNIRYDHDINAMRFITNTNEAIRIDSSGNLLVGKTSTSTTTAGGEINADGTLVGVRDGGGPLLLNRLSSDGTLASFRKGGTIMGSIDSYSSAVLGMNLRVTTNKSGFRGAASSIIPWYDGADRDDELNVGNATVRWKDLYLSGGAYLGGTGSANYLDDYEEGTFTVTPTFGTSGSATLDRDLLSYTKIGQVVYITGQIQLNVLSSPTGPLTINVPFAVKSAAGSDRETNSFFVGKFQSLNAAPPTGSDGDDFWVSADGSAITLQFYNGYTNTATDLDGTYLKSGTRLTITGWYLAT